MNHDQSKPEWNQKKTGSSGLNPVLSASLERSLVYSKWHRFMKRVFFFSLPTYGSERQIFYIQWIKCYTEA